MLGELILSLASSERPVGRSTERATDPLYELRREFPDLLDRVKGKAVLDFGCGLGDQVAAMAAVASSATGIDNNLSKLATARSRYPEVEFLPELPSGRKFDVIISQDSMEHFRYPGAALATMVEALAPDGIILMTFGPAWYSPYGAHMHFFCRLPWMHLYFSERAVMNVRAKFRSDGAKRYEDVESGLNRMSLRKFETLVGAFPLRIERKIYRCIRNIAFLSRLPVIRELATSQVTVILRRI